MATPVETAALRNEIEKHKIFVTLLIAMSHFKPSSPEWAALVEICDGKDSAYDIAQHLAEKTFLATRDTPIGRHLLQPETHL